MTLNWQPHSLRLIRVAICHYWWCSFRKSTNHTQTKEDTTSSSLISCSLNDSFWSATGIEYYGLNTQLLLNTVFEIATLISFPVSQLLISSCRRAPWIYNWTIMCNLQFNYEKHNWRVLLSRIWETVIKKEAKEKECGLWGSNSRPWDYETHALPTEPKPLYLSFHSDSNKYYFVIIR